MATEESETPFVRQDAFDFADSRQIGGTETWRQALHDIHFPRVLLQRRDGRQTICRSPIDSQGDKHRGKINRAQTNRIEISIFFSFSSWQQSLWT